MNGRNRHIQYRRSVYRKRRLRLFLILGGILLVLLVAAFLIVGTVLNNGREDPPSDSDTDLEDTASSDDPVPAPSVQAYPVRLQTDDSTNFSGRIRRLLENGGRAASVPLNLTDGTPLYRSPLVISLGMASENYTVTLENALNGADEDVHLSGVYHLSALGLEDDLMRTVALGESAALIAEAFRAGLDDVVLMTPALTEDNLDAMLRFADELRALCPDGVLGLCLSESILDAGRSAILVDDLVHAFDFLAIDATEYGENPPEDHVKSVAGKRLDLLLRYRARLILPELVETEAQNAVIAAAGQYNVTNWQILPS